MSLPHWRIEVNILGGTIFSCFLSCCIIVYPFILFLGGDLKIIGVLLFLAIGFILILPFVLGFYLPLILYISKTKNSLKTYVLVSGLTATLSGSFLLLYSNYAFASPGESTQIYWLQFIKMLSFFIITGLIHGFIHYKITSKPLGLLAKKND